MAAPLPTLKQPAKAAPAAAPRVLAPASGAPAKVGGGVAPSSPEVDLTTIIKPKKYGEVRPANHVLLIGNKGCKTIAAMALPLIDGMSLNRRTRIRATPGLPIPEGSRRVIITFDGQTLPSLDGYYGVMMEQFGVEIIAINEPVFGPCPEGCLTERCSHKREVLYPGWDGGTARSGPIVVKALKAWLTKFRDAGNVGFLMADHYGKFLTETTKYFAYSKANVPLDQKLDPSGWVPRQNIINDLDDMMRNAVMPGGWLIATGSRDQREGNEKTTFDKKKSDGSMDVRKEVVPANWTEKILHNWPNVIQVYKNKLGEGRYERIAEVEEGRHPIFVEGASVNINGRHIGAFQDEAAVQYPEADAETDEESIKAALAQPQVVRK